MSERGTEIDVLCYLYICYVGQEVIECLHVCICCVRATVLAICVRERSLGGYFDGGSCYLFTNNYNTILRATIWLLKGYLCY